MYQAFTETDQVTFDDAVLPATATWKDVSRPPTNIVSARPDPAHRRGHRPHARLAAGSAVQHRRLHRLRRRADRQQPQRLPAVRGLRRRLELRPPDGPLRQVGLRPADDLQRRRGQRPRRLVLLAGRRRVHLLGQPRRRHHVPAEPAGRTRSRACSWSPPASAARACTATSTPRRSTARRTCRTSPATASEDPRDQPAGGRGLARRGPELDDPAGPGRHRRPNFDSDPAVDVDEGNRAYVAYENATSNLMVATTTDQGETFTPVESTSARRSGSRTPRCRP